LRDLVAALAAVPILALVYAEAAARRLRLAWLLAAPALASVYASEMVRRPRLGISALVVVMVPLVAIGTVAAVAPAGLDARPPARSGIDPADLRALPTGAAPTDDAAPSADAGSQDQPITGDMAADAEGGASEPDMTTTGQAPSSGIDTPAPPAAAVARADGPGYGEAPAGQPAVVRFRPQGSASEVARGALLSVRFDRPMAHEATESAFRAAVDGRPLAGALSWAEGDTVLVFDPADPLPYGARVVLGIGTDARDATGQPLERERAVSFTVQPRPTPAPTARPVSSRSTGGSTAAPQRSSAVVADGWQWPVIGPITQYFGQSLTIYGTHYGIDIDGDTGDQVRAAAAGTVIVAGYYDKCGGLDVHIDHGDGLVSWYRHLSRVLVSEGDRVERGDLIGRMGNTGCSFGSHLHFALRRGSTWIDPLTVLPRR
jgi:biotin carboxyl carrier protein